ncbi:hypothetical protein CAPTEDRAFT_190869 [Capitella teleta]|uniref:Uncharacterized protein n=1 Tax=Capitella teleta TaxID=283909 RepID=R7TF81_CAPTE|nr:hypothetical protein CAPTEDRAFT_190869 [Capitella teleta]|eukprot:ELT92394.1 hypothetical protein CAPTEDRAFT_190869 [Capitella teleta]
MMWVDPANWTTTPEELEAMDKKVQHFEAPLQAAGFKKDRLKAECCSMKTTYKYYNAGQDAATFWAKSFKHSRAVLFCGGTPWSYVSRRRIAGNQSAGPDAKA